MFTPTTTDFMEEECGSLYHPFSLSCSYLMHKIHSKVYPAVCKVLSREDRAFSERCQRLMGRLTPSSLGVPEDYSCRYSLTLAALGRIEQLNSPLEKLYCLQEAMVSTLMHH